MAITKIRYIDRVNDPTFTEFRSKTPQMRTEYDPETGLLEVNDLYLSLNHERSSAVWH